MSESKKSEMKKPQEGVPKSKQKEAEKIAKQIAKDFGPAIKKLSKT